MTHRAIREPLTPAQTAALASFAERNGPRWKDKLNALWLDGADDREPEGPLLRQIRNAIGPSGLRQLSLAALDAGSANDPPPSASRHQTP